MRLLKHLPRFRRAYAEMDELAAREAWPRERIEAHQLDRVNALWAEATAHVPYYRALAASASLPPRFGSLEEFGAAVPLLPKSAVRADREALVSDRALPGKWHLTGGSTGASTSVFRSHAAHRAMLRARYRFHASWGVDIFDRWAYLWGHSASFEPGLRGRLARVRQPINDRLRNRRRASAYRMGSADLRDALARFAAFDPHVIYAYSTAGYLLAREKLQADGEANGEASADRAATAMRSLKMVNLTAEPAFPHIVAAVERAFGVPAVVEYGSCECGFLAGEAPDRTLRVREDRALVETLPRPDGRYDLVVTVLDEPSYPLLRYAIGDVTDAPLDRRPDGFAVLSNVGGRDNDLVYSRSGEPLHSLWFDDLFDYHDAVRRYRVHQSADGAVAVTIERTSPEARLDAASLRSAVAAHGGYGVTVEAVDALPPTSAGKHRWISSDLADPHRAA